MYRRLLSDLRAKNDALKVIGLTATPYRLSGGLLTRGSSKIFTSVAHDVEVGPLVEQGYLAPLSSPATSAAYDTSAVSTVGGDFAIGELVGAVDRQTEITHAAMTEALALTADRRARLVFCVSIEHAECVARWLRDANQACEVITGDTDPLMRSSVIGRFRRGDLPWLVGVDVLTTGFDAPCCDAIVLLRPTQSTSLYVQIVGRGMRIADGKTDCIVLDYGGNIERHGPITAIKHSSKAASDTSTLKVCKNCMAEVKISKRECPECGYIFPKQPRDIDHDKTASRKAIIGPPPEPVWVEIDDVRASEWVKQAKEGEAPKPPTVCVEYLRGGRAVVKEWLCPEHGGYAAQKFCRWWFDAGGDLPAPHTVALALERIDAGELKRIEAVQVGKDGQYDRVLARRFGVTIHTVPAAELVDDDPLPF
jgi:DNA repair protein RadD